ncbi:hypothetical protein GTPT_0540 [Tatumella ptyseos ATCC 33301]|uniref:Uncharacterized protein n=1 Tax=Tatumella ptyseos ATCC 33301 TaxID=1005995 RepID=A0A085JPH0_9GAMM|nr:hypothetical protein GTPT_0540 [Tatumella ptyseos ATCC 33301]
MFIRGSYRLPVSIIRNGDETGIFCLWHIIKTAQMLITGIFAPEAIISHGVCTAERLYRVTEPFLRLFT